MLRKWHFSANAFYSKWHFQQMEIHSKWHFTANVFMHEYLFTSNSSPTLGPTRKLRVSRRLTGPNSCLWLMKSSHTFGYIAELITSSSDMASVECFSINSLLSRRKLIGGKCSPGRPRIGFNPLRICNNNDN